ncbi:efflux RND transporter permease subunit [Cellvibrio japonicus]|uniref:RND transporter, Hydrophobe/Amphiphile Efflux family n=1 Tax=Cellvibrio japonicus (strain Ueda107) TaxID=498211 RepID=B3PK07_CELJU|nr:efflux RND transporter permease subunit [Cellvibrio japonicus]ACE84308.1 RND transporter, Hydrophobe/Amphiphile Efflux family [Cellvibrio japonicus Ueda107]QEI12775.1 efflux RND transporter permease subunit [Cellvibrio japonicus]QEI16349.1 efflux RND transporter permease subunit [Cellvibrio japonicus]QEI19927.1 efflux RND transporter permease subunit [Cellvibrio japonicus]
MILSDVSIKRPVFASVLSMLLIAFGLVAFERLTLREYPNIDPPVVSIRTTYPGAAANIVETRITKVLEDRISGVEGIRFIESSSENGISNIVVQFDTGHDMDAAANDIRDRVSRALGNLPDEADPPEVQKVSSDEDVIIWFNFAGENMTMPELTDYAQRYLIDRFSVIDGVARVRIGGEQRYAMRVWLDRRELAARDLTVNDVEMALRAENVELPAGSIESLERQFTVRMARSYRTVDQFNQLVIKRGNDGYLVRLGDVARVEKGTEEDRTLFRGNGVTQVGIGIVKQSTANTIDVARGVKAERDKINAILPEGMALRDSYDSSVFVERAIHEVYLTLSIALVLVVIVIYLFLGSVRATLVPAVAVPVSIIATFTVLAVMGFSVNMLTLLALVLAIGLVVDDAIVVLENIVRHMEEKAKPSLLAAYDGVKEVGFAVIATTLVLIAIFVPIVFLKGDIGRLFSEFAITMAAAVGFSSLVALTLSPMMASKVLKSHDTKNPVVEKINEGMQALRVRYKKTIRWCLTHKTPMVIVFVAMVGVMFLLMRVIPSEYAPREDRGTFFVMVNGPEGASYAYMEDYMAEIEKRMMRYVDSGEVTRLMVRAPRSFGAIESFNSGMIIAVMNDWSLRRNAFVVMDEIRAALADLPGVTAAPVMRQGFGSQAQKPVQFVLGGGTYEELAQWRDTLLEKLEQDNPGLTGIDWDYKETKPQIEVVIDTNRAADLGVSVNNIGRTLEAMLGSRRATTYIDDGEEYDVILQGERNEQRTTTSLQNMYVRSERSGELIPLSNVVSLREIADASRLNRYNRMRSLTIEANLADNLTLSEALDHLNGLVREHLPSTVVVDYKGLSRDYQTASGSIMFIFVLGILVTFLVLAAQFESYVHPLVIMLTVPLAILGGMIGLYVTGSTFNLYSQIGLIMLIGMAAKNGILIVEFANQLRDRGMEFTEALLDASSARLRPILMTSLTAVAGAIPLVISSGAGAETRFVIGIVVIFGILLATFLTLFFVPVAYSLLARHTGSPGDVERTLQQQQSSYNNLDE